MNEARGWTPATYGHEYIKLLDPTNRAFIMKAYGYAESDAQVDYSWTGANTGGGGDFQQHILNGAVIEVGEIPPGLSGIDIDLTAPADADIQLYDKATGTAIVAWPNGIIGKQGDTDEVSTVYEGVEIVYSGYNGGQW